MVFLLCELLNVLETAGTNKLLGALKTTVGVISIFSMNSRVLIER